MFTKYYTNRYTSLKLCVHTKLISACLFFLSISNLLFSQSLSQTRSAGTLANFNIGNINWRNPNNATSTDGVTSTSASRLRFDNDQTDYLRLSNFGFTIPTTSVIRGLSVNVTRRTVGGTGIEDKLIQFSISGVLFGDNKFSTNNWTTAYQTASYGSSTDLWGSSLPVATVNATTFQLNIASVRTAAFDLSNQFPHIDNVTVTVHYTSTLPVSLVEFKATLLNKDIVNVEWTTATEVNSDNFVLQSSNNGVDFENISEFKAAGISSSTLEYSHADRITYSDQKIKYYQLIQRDVDGVVTKYGPIAVDLRGLPTEILLYPNPASNELTFQVDSDLEIQKIEVTTLDGKRVVQLDYNFQNRLDLTDLPEGTYLLSLFDRDQVRQATKRFIKKVI